MENRYILYLWMIVFDEKIVVQISHDNEWRNLTAGFYYVTFFWRCRRILMAISVFLDQENEISIEINFLKVDPKVRSDIEDEIKSLKWKEETKKRSDKKDEENR